MSDAPEDTGTVQRGALDLVFAALSGLGRNRLPLPLTQRIHRAKKHVAELVSEREELRKALIEQYRPEDAGESWQGFASVEDAPDELMEKLTELQTEDVSLELGKPIRLNEAAGIELSAEHYGVLIGVGVLQADEAEGDGT